jgi:hypothetical protein
MPLAIGGPCVHADIDHKCALTPNLIVQMGCCFADIDKAFLLANARCSQKQSDTLWLRPLSFEHELMHGCARQASPITSIRRAKNAEK